MSKEEQDAANGFWERGGGVGADNLAAHLNLSLYELTNGWGYTIYIGFECWNHELIGRYYPTREDAKAACVKKLQELAMNKVS